jgi:putative membrane protein
LYNNVLTNWVLARILPSYFHATEASMLHRWITLPTLALLALGCAKTEDTNTDQVQDTATVSAPTPAPAGPSDAEIAHIVVTANTIDVEAGELAKSKASNAEVRQFGQKMITDHNGVNQQAGALAQKLNLTPADNATSQSLKTSADQTKQRLQGLSGAEFDRAYIDNEVTFHQAVLDAIDNTLIPNAQNAELKTLIQQVRPAIDGHLKMAQGIQQKLPK